MDILPTPHNPTSPTVKVPYVCSDRYDGLAFLTYPARRGRPEIVTATFPPGAEFGMQEKAHPTPVAELESLYQTWLYFGLLFEFLNLNEDSPGVPPRTEGSKEEEMEAVYKYFTTSSEDGERLVTSRLIFVPELELWKWEGDEETLKGRCRHLFECLRITHWMLQYLPPDFDPRIKYSIAALAEFFNFNLGTKTLTSGWKDVQLLSFPWAKGVLTKGVRKRMRENGWCPSAIEEMGSRFNGLQTMNLVSKMDRGGPRRDHERCTERMCVNYQIDNSTYRLSHAEEGCECSTLEVDCDAITEILMASDTSIPLLKVSPGNDLEELRLEVIPSSPCTPYVALSHVWADGLGNPYSNSLHRCQISRLHQMMSQFNAPSPATESLKKPAPLLWVDTLCCPASNGPGKQNAIRKLRRVYQYAIAVLVLDASLFSISSLPLHTSEILLRAYTSPWTRRLWTLQEGALNSALHFQFADRAVSAQGLIDELKSTAWNTDVRYMHPYMDLEQEYNAIRSFFHASKTSDSFRQMETLEAALQSRSFSVASDEPLCIATLMALDLSAIIALEGVSLRMRDLWRLLAAKLGGIPSSIIFYEDQCLSFEGWRWAPRSFRPVKRSLFDLDARKMRWMSGPRELGAVTYQGLRCKFPGFRLGSCASEGNRAWRGVYRPTETAVLLRDRQGVWYTLNNLNMPALTEVDYLERMKDFRLRKGWPLKDAIEGGKCAVVLETNLRRKNGTERDAIRGILVRIKSSGDDENGTLSVDRTMHVLVATLYEQEAMVQETYRKIWLRMREDELTRKLEKIEDETSIEFKMALREATDKMRKIMKEELETNPEFLAAMPRLYGENYDPDSLWIRMASWWEQENVGEWLPSDQLWCVD